MADNALLVKCRSSIKKYAPQVDITSHAHNIITLDLLTISTEFGTDEANRAIRDFKLESKGWNQHESICQH